MQDQSAIFITSSSGTLLFTAAVVETPRTEWALKMSESIPAFFDTMRSHRRRVGAVIGLCDLT